MNYTTAMRQNCKKGNLKTVEDVKLKSEKKGITKMWCMYQTKQVWHGFMLKEATNTSVCQHVSLLYLCFTTSKIEPVGLIHHRAL